MDQIHEHYEQFIDSEYDCTDRLAINAYIGFLNNPGGFRVWWRDVFGGDANLDKTHLMKFASRFGRRIRAYTEKAGIPVAKAEKGQRNEELLGQMNIDPARIGLYAVIIKRGATRVWNARRYGDKGLDLSKKTTHANYYYFYIRDPQWGTLMIRFCPHPPFPALILLNGHDFMQNEAELRGIHLERDENCFTHIPDGTDLGFIAETMKGSAFVGRVSQVCANWIYTCCLNFILNPGEKEASRLDYSYSVYQAEYSRNYLFHRGRIMEDAFENIINRSRSYLDCHSIKTIFGCKQRPYYHGKPLPISTVVEKPDYNLTVFKIHFGACTAKIYSKGAHVLRVEIIVHNARRLRCGCLLEALPDILDVLNTHLDRFVAALQCVGAPLFDKQIIEDWTQSEKNGKVTTPGVCLDNQRIKVALLAITAMSATAMKIRSSELAQFITSHSVYRLPDYTQRQAAYDLKKLTAKGILQRPCKGSPYSVPEMDKLRKACGYIVLKEEVLEKSFALMDIGVKRRVPKLENPLWKAAEHNLEIAEHASKIVKIIGLKQAS